MNEIVQQLEYKGYQFDVTMDSEVRVSGVDVFHKPLRSGKCYYESIDDGLYEFSLTFVISSQDASEYKQRRAFLLKLLREGKVGELIHPYFGRLIVACDRSSLTIKESGNELGMCYISSSFKEVTFKLPPKDGRKPADAPATPLTPATLVVAVKSKNSFLQKLTKNLRMWLKLASSASIAKLITVNEILMPISKGLSVLRAIEVFVGQSVDKVSASVSRAVTALNRASANAIGSVAALKANVLGIRAGITSGINSTSKLLGLSAKSSASAFHSPSIRPTKFGQDLPSSSYVMLSNDHIDNQKNLIDYALTLTLSESNELGALQNADNSSFAATQRLASIVTDMIDIGQLTKSNTIEISPNQDYVTELASRIVNLETEFLNAYTALLYVNRVNETEFTKIDDVIKTLDTLYKVSELLDTFTEMPDEVVAQFKAYIADTSTFIYNNIEDVQTITNVNTKNLPLRVVSYRLYGSTEPVSVLYELNGEWFDLGESPDKIKILE